MVVKHIGVSIHEVETHGDRKNLHIHLVLSVPVPTARAQGSLKHRPKRIPRFVGRVNGQMGLSVRPRPAEGITGCHLHSILTATVRATILWIYPILMSRSAWVQSPQF